MEPRARSIVVQRAYCTRQGNRRRLYAVRRMGRGTRQIQRPYRKMEIPA